MPRREDHGFTLIEVLAAVLIVSLVFGLLLESVTRNLADLGRSRLEARAADLAEQRARDLVTELAAGAALECGRRHHGMHVSHRPRRETLADRAGGGEISRLSAAAAAVPRTAGTDPRTGRRSRLTPPGGAVAGAYFAT